MGVIIMSNKEAAEILKNLLSLIYRGDTQSTTKLVITEALCKGIKALENTPETNPKD